MDPHIIIRTAHKTYCGANWHWDSRLQSGDIRLGYNLWYVAKGRGLLETPGGPFELRRGDCFLLRSWEEHLGTSVREDPVVVSWCCYDYFDARGRRLDPGKVRIPQRHRFLPETVFFESLMDRLIEAYQEAPDGPQPVQWLQSALNEVEQQDSRIRTLQGIDLEHAELIDLICRNIRENPGRKFRIPQLAAKSSMCIDHFIRVFRRHKGMTPGDYIVDSRIEAARGLLQFSTHNISQVAELLGYRNVYAFSKQFKERTGKPPTHYRGRKG
ncbi:MAG: hypothetical protein A2X45_02835 [Lentisphaerae bacterium GWF2_50_93]|nr:MAG: hypothetical protein A2X45_02835 [Lentisphaerae bacterium GWF2_50_93]